MIKFVADANIERKIVDCLIKLGFDVKWIPDYNCEMKEEALLKRITINPNIMLGKPIIKGTRLTVEFIIEKLAYGATYKDLKEDYPFIDEDDIRSALLYAAKSLAHEEVYAA